MPSTDTRQASYQSALDDLAEAGQLRRCREVETKRFPHCEVEGRPALNFSSNDYLGLAHDERLKHAAIDAIHKFGTGTGSSRLICGTTPLAKELELALATFKGTESALVFNSGYQANVGILQAVLKPGDWVFCDKLNHASLIDGCLLSGARWSRYRHLDLNHLEQKLQKAPKNARKWIVTDSVFSMDGDYPDLVALVDLAEKYGAFTLVDEAHATGLYGTKSSGLCEQFGMSSRITLQMGTFSKAMGGSGAYVAGSWTMIDTLINQARSFIYSTALSPSCLGSAIKALEIIEHDPAPRQKLWQNVETFRAACSAEGVEIPAEKSPIVPIIIGDSTRALAWMRSLLDSGFFVQAIRPPTVPQGTARLRVTLTASHDETQLKQLAKALSGALDEHVS